MAAEKTNRGHFLKRNTCVFCADVSLTKLRDPIVSIFLKRAAEPSVILTQNLFEMQDEIAQDH